MVPTPYAFNTPPPAAIVSSLPLGDDTESGTPLPFVFTFMGVTFSAGSQVWVGSNGYIYFGNTLTTTPIGATCYVIWPTATVPSYCPNTFVVSIWMNDLIYLPSVGASAQVWTEGSPGSRLLVLSFENVTHYTLGTATPPVSPNLVGGEQAILSSFQVKILERTNRVEVHYKDARVNDNLSNDNRHVMGVGGANSSVDNLNLRAFLPLPPATAYSYVPQQQVADPSSRPEAQGYRCNDIFLSSTQPVLQSDIGLPFVSNLSSSSLDVLLPFNFTFFGVDYDRITICSDGYITFGWSLCQAYAPTPSPVSAPPASVYPSDPTQQYYPTPVGYAAGERQGSLCSVFTFSVLSLCCLSLSSLWLAL